MKSDFIQALFDDMPATVGAYLETPIGDVVDIPVPTTKDTAVIACGQLAANLNNAFLKPFVGLTPIELFMRIGQKNPVFISSLLAGLETISGSGGKMQIDIPKNGGTYQQLKTIVVSGIGIQTLTANLNESDLTLSDNNDVWNYTFDTFLEPGEYSLICKATFDDGAQGSAISIFTVKAAEHTFAPTFPTSGQSYPAGSVPFSATGTEISSVSVEVGGQTAQLSKSGDNWTASISLTPGEYSANFLATFTDEDTMPAYISFTVV